MTYLSFTKEQVREIHFEAAKLILDILGDGYIEDVECSDINEAISSRVEGYFTCCEHCTIPCEEEWQIDAENVMYAFISEHKAGRDAIAKIAAYAAKTMENKEPTDG